MPTNSINSGKKSLYIAGVISIALIIYLALVLIDGIAEKYRQFITGAEATELEHQRACDEDYQQIEEARNLGYKSLLYPDLFDKEPFKAVALKHGIAPLAPQPHTNLYYCNEGYGQVRYTSDRYGFRNKDALWDKPSADILLIGDSFTQGACVPEEKNISGVLIAKGLASINLGSASNSPIHYAALARTFIKIKKVKTAVIIFYPNDNIETEKDSVFNRFFFERATVHYFGDTKQPGSPPLSASIGDLYKDSGAIMAAEVPGLVEERHAHMRECKIENSIAEHLRSLGHSLVVHFKLFTIRSLLGNYLVSFKPAKPQPGLPYGSTLAIDTLQKECKENNCRPLVVYIPNSEFWRPDARAPRFAELLKEYTESRGIQFIDTRPELKKLGDGAYAAKGGHLSPEGYKTVADEIAGTITK